MYSNDSSCYFLTCTYFEFENKNHHLCINCFVLLAWSTESSRKILVFEYLYDICICNASPDKFIACIPWKYDVKQYTMYSVGWLFYDGAVFMPCRNRQKDDHGWSDSKIGQLDMQIKLC